MKQKETAKQKKTVKHTLVAFGLIASMLVTGCASSASTPQTIDSVVAENETISESPAAATENGKDTQKGVVTETVAFSESEEAQASSDAALMSVSSMSVSAESAADDTEIQTRMDQIFEFLESAKGIEISSADQETMEANRDEINALMTDAAEKALAVGQFASDLVASGETLTAAQIVQIDRLLMTYEEDIQSMLDEIESRIGSDKQNRGFTVERYIEIQEQQIEAFQSLNAVLDDLLDILSIEPADLNELPFVENGDLQLGLIRPTEKVRVGKDFVLSGIDALPDDGLVNDPGYAYQWAIEATHANEAWSILSGGYSVKIAVIDTGIDATHPDLQGQVDTALGYDFVNEDADASDDNGHGTHVSGIIAAVPNNGIGIAGIVGATPVTLIPIKVLNENGSGTLDDIVSGIEYAIDLQVDIINLSVGANGMNEAIESALNDAAAHDIAVFVAAGNDGASSDGSSFTVSPATYTVAATNPVETTTSFSNYGNAVDIAAPGKKVLSTIPNGEYEAWDGTSMATPIVTGIAAMMLSESPNLSAAQIYSILSDTAQDILEDGDDIYSGAGLADAYQAVKTAQSN
ncbi:MAG: serine protease [Clostridiales bacterium]|nr:serine protease [Clostridiales bacterium]